MQVSLRERYLDVVLVERVVYRLLHLTGLAELVVDKHPISHEEIHRVVAEVVEHHAYWARTRLSCISAVNLPSDSANSS